jgi:competence protein ComEC
VNDLRLAPAALAGWLTCALGLGGSIWVWAGLVSACCLLGGGLAARAGKGCPREAIATACLAAAAVVAAAWNCSVQTGVRDQGLLGPLAHDRATVEVTGVLRSEVSPLAARADRDDRFRGVLAVEEVAGRGQRGSAAASVLVIGGADWAELAYGTRVEARGRLAPAEPGDEVRAILWSASVEVRDPPEGLDGVVARIRSGLLEATDPMPPDLRGLVPGTSIGDTRRLPADLRQAMRDVSLTHVTAVSGAHFAVLSVTVLMLTAALPRWARAVVCTTVMSGFVLLVHPQPSVVRAAVMGAVAVIGLVAGRRSRACSALSTAVLLLMLLNPWLARSYGFVLSVLATGAIALLAPALARRLARWCPRWLAVAVAVPLAAQAVCAPVLVLLDPGVSLYAVPANVLAAPALLPATVLGVCAAVTVPWAPLLGSWLASAAGAANWWIASVARTAAGLPGARQPWLDGPTGAALLALVVLAGILALRARGRRRLIAALLGAALAAAPALRAPLTVLLRPVPADWVVVACDVGQGDMLVVRSAPGAALVIDAGPEGQAGAECLDRLGVHRIDLLVLTHYHADHVGGLVPVLDGREVREAMVSPLGEPQGEAARTRGALEGAGVPVRTGTAGQSGVAGDLAWEVLSPPAHGHGVGPEAANDASVVLVVRSGGLSVLALGDVGASVQQRLVRHVTAVDVVKVAHHGSADQYPPLASRAAARLALITVGPNDYGHPADSAVAAHHDAGSVVLRTDECGDLVVGVTDGQVWVSAHCVPGDDTSPWQA